METILMGLVPLARWIFLSTVKASVVICLILIVRALLRNRLASRWWYALWVIVLIRLLCPWVPQSRLSVFNIGSQPQAGTRTPAVLNAAVQDVSFTTSQPKLSPASGEAKSQIPVEWVATTIPTYRLKMSEILSLVWLAGALFVGAFALISDIRLWYTIRAQQNVTDADVMALFEDCKKAMGVHATVGLVLTDCVDAPCVFGVVRPRILLPLGTLESLRGEQLRHVFLHEFAHLRRFDNLWGTLILLVQVIHWFNPLIWLSFHRMRTDRELACDTLVLSAMAEGEQNQYGLTIMDLSAGLARLHLLPSITGIVESKSFLTRRIEMIAQYHPQKQKKQGWPMVLVVLFSLLTLTDARLSARPVSSVVGELSDDLCQNLLLYYSFDEGSGTTAMDVSGRNNHGSVVNAGYLSESGRGDVLAFNGDNSQIVVDDITLKEFTFAAWVKTHTLDLNNRVLFQLLAGDLSYSIQGGSNHNVSVYIGADAEVVDDGGLFNSRRWMHLTVTYDGTSVMIYRNGSEYHTGQVPPTEAVQGPIYIGGAMVWRDINSGFWHGALDEVALFNRSLSAEDVKPLYALSALAIEEIPEEVVPENNGPSEMILLGVGMGRFRFGINKDEVLDRQGVPRAIFYGDQRYSLDNLPDRYFMSYQDISFGIKHDLVQGMTALTNRYRFANGIAVGDSEDEVKQAFGDGYTVEETKWKDFLIYDDLGLSFEINLVTRNVMEINMQPESPIEPPSASIASSPILNPGNGHYYQCIDARVNWHTAKQLAAASTYQELQGHLATVTSAEENQWIFDNLGGRSRLRRHWIGGLLEDGQWQWITGEAFAYTHWTPHEPNGEPHEDGLEYDDDDQVSYPAHTWNDYPSGAPENGYIVEYE
ncbi:M56 family metallopeptidase [Planctomycetota bacterium]